MRGVVVVLITIFVAATAIFVAGAAVEPLGEHIKGYDSIDEGPLSGTSVIDTTYDVVFVYAPMIIVFGMLIWAVAWYVRKERFVGGRPP